MDFFGIGAALQGCVSIYFRAARNTNRSRNLAKSLKFGDQVIFSKRTHLVSFKRLLVEMGVSADVKLTVVDRDRMDLNGSHCTQGRTYFDHSFIEEYYTMRINDAGKYLNNLENDLSGNPESHNNKMYTRNKQQYRL